jgi:hypothetical protein
MVNHDYFNQLVLGLKGSDSTLQSQSWAAIYVLQRQDDGTYRRADFSEFDSGTLAPFALLHAVYATENRQLRTDTFFDLLKLGSYRPTFAEALSRPASATKLVDRRSQAALRAIFGPLTTHPEEEKKAGVMITEDHLKELTGIHGPRALAYRLLCLSALFTRYSSSHVFGMENDSPVALRSYAAALLNTATRCDAKLLSEANRRDWENRLLGNNRAFTCTAVLFDMMKQVLRELRDKAPPAHGLETVYADTMPLGW